MIYCTGCGRVLKPEEKPETVFHQPVCQDCRQKPTSPPRYCTRCGKSQAQGLIASPEGCRCSSSAIYVNRRS